MFFKTLWQLSGLLKKAFNDLYLFFGERNFEINFFRRFLLDVFEFFGKQLNWEGKMFRFPFLGHLFISKYQKSFSYEQNYKEIRIVTKFFHFLAHKSPNQYWISDNIAQVFLSSKSPHWTEKIGREIIFHYKMFVFSWQYHFGTSIWHTTKSKKKV